MRKLASHLFTLAAAVSLLLMVMVAIHWGASYHPFRATSLDSSPAPGGELAGSRGRLRLAVPLGRGTQSAVAAIPYPYRPLQPGDTNHWTIGQIEVPTPGGSIIRVRNFELSETATSRRLKAASVEEVWPAARLLGCEWLAGRSSAGGFDADAAQPVTFRSWGALTVPHGYPFVAAAALPAVWFGRTRRRARRRRRGHCPSCGYDLRASPDRCPECGAASPVGSLAG